MVSRLRLLFLMVLGCAFCTLRSAHSEPVPRQIDGAERVRNLDRVKKDMPAKTVLEFYGTPDRKARQVLYRRYLEQWIYLEPEGLWVEFDCLKGQEPRVLDVHKPEPKAP